MAQYIGCLASRVNWSTRMFALYSRILEDQMEKTSGVYWERLGSFPEWGDPNIDPKIL